MTGHLERAVARTGEHDGRPLLVLEPPRGTGATRRVCAWCSGPIAAGARSDAITCSKRCRQARHRFTSAVGVADRTAEQPVRLAYADPPYPGKARRYYRTHPDYAGEVDHAALIAELATFDGWALSTSAAALPDVLVLCRALCPAPVRVAAWFRGSRNGRSTLPQSAWEPVIYVPGRPVAADVGRDRSDALVHIARARTTDPSRVIGAKPPEFARWVFELLGAATGDTLHDMFPGSRAISRAWDIFTAREDTAHA